MCTTVNRQSEDLKVRLPQAVKAALRRVADSRYTSESEIAREALIAYLRQFAPADLKGGPDEMARRVRSTANLAELKSRRKK